MRAARDGMRVCLSGRSQSALISVAAEVGSSDDNVWTCDFGDPDGVEDAVDLWLRRNGTVVNHLVYAAGQSQMQPAKALTQRVMANLMNVNCNSALLLASSLAKPRINGRELKSITFISTIWAESGSRGHIAYSASKAALDAGMRGLAVELAPRIRVNSVALGAVETRMFNRGQHACAYKRAQASYPLGVASPGMVAGAVLFLLSNDAQWITGSVFHVDGGRSIVGDN